MRRRPELERPYVVLAVHAVCAEDDATARRRALPAGLTFVRLRQGRPSRIPTVEQAEAYPWTADERAFVEARVAQQAVGGPDTVAARLADLLERTRADELMFSTLVHDARHRLESLERVHGLFGVVGG